MFSHTKNLNRWKFPAQSTITFSDLTAPDAKDVQIITQFEKQSERVLISYETLLAGASESSNSSKNRHPNVACDCIK